MGEIEQPVTAVIEPQDLDAAAPETAEPGLLLHGVVRARRGGRSLAKVASGADELVDHKGLSALVHIVPYRLPTWEVQTIREHSATIERAMRRGTVVPAPYGIVFKGRDQVTEFLENQRIALEEALAFLDGAFEMRLHIRPSGGYFNLSEGEQADRTAEFYTALRRRSRAAFKLPPKGQRILSGAFLVNRADWVSFVEYADELDAEHPEFLFDLTGPWPPYDFVRMTFFHREEPSG
jgi:hypothetical protein